MLLTLILSCQDYAINKQEGGIPIIAPDFIDFGHLVSGQEVDTRQIIFTNGGDQPFEVDRIEIFGQRFEIDETNFIVEPESWIALDLTYSPQTFEFNEGYLDVYLKGQEAPVSSVWFQGWGDAPSILIDPEEIDFGTVSQDCSLSEEITITNVGNLPLEISSINQLSSIPQEISLNLGTLPPLPWVLQPTDRISFSLDFVASDVLSDTLALKVLSNDPSWPSKDVSAQGLTMISTTMVDSWVQGSGIVVDIIWVIDNSGSMRWAQNELAANLTSFINMFISYNPTFKMAFITTDSPNFWNGITLTQNTPDLVSSATNLLNSIGTWGSADEKGLEMLETSISNNINWFNPNAYLVAIFLSDEPDHSSYSWSLYATLMDAHIPFGRYLPYAIIGDVPWGCNAAQAGRGYYETVNYYGTQWWSICDPDWGSNMEDIALSIINAAAFTLSMDNLKEDTIEVWVNGQKIESGWTYNANSNSIMFDPGFMPETGDNVEASYEIWECE